MPIPYGANQAWAFTHTEKDEEFTINWNGFASTVASKSGTPEAETRAVRIAEALNAPVEGIKRVTYALIVVDFSNRVILLLR